MRDPRGRCVLCEIDEVGGGGSAVKEREGVCVCVVREACDFGKWFTKNLGINCFPKFCTAFSGQHKSFAVD